MLTSETPEASQPHPASPLIGRSCRISTTPASPSSNPVHCSGVTRSPSQRLAIVEVRIGCRPGNQRREPGRNRMRDRDRRAAEIEAVHQNARRRCCGAMPIRSGHFGRATATMIAISPTTQAMRIAR